MIPRLCSGNAQPQKDGESSLTVLLCSRNAHDKNVLVRRAHSRIDQATLENEMGNWEERGGKINQPPSPPYF